MKHAQLKACVDGTRHLWEDHNTWWHWLSACSCCSLFIPFLYRIIHDVQKLAVFFTTAQFYWLNMTPHEQSVGLQMLVPLTLH